MSDRADEVDAARGDLMRVAFRMLGTVADAEDAVQAAADLSAAVGDRQPGRLAHAHDEPDLPRRARHGEGPTRALCRRVAA